jgi:hypothetical protein
MCSPEAALVGGKALVDLKKEQASNSAAQIRTSQEVASNAKREALSKESLKVKLVDSLRLEAQETKKAAKKGEVARKSGLAERASVIAMNPFQVGRGNTLNALLRDSSRREAETKFSISDNLKSLNHQFRTGRQIDILNTGTQIASLTPPSAIADPTLGILGVLADNAPKIRDEVERLNN